MKKQILVHVLLWLCYFSIDILGYLKFWNHKVTISTISQYCLLIATFYICYFIASRKLKNRHEINGISRKGKILTLTALSTIYVGATYYLDRYVLFNYYGPTVWAYCTMRLYMILPILFGIITHLTNKNGYSVVANFKKEQHRLKLENEELQKSNMFLKVQMLVNQEYLNEIHREYQDKQAELQKIIDDLKGFNSYD